MPRFKSRRAPAQSARFTNNAGWRITNAGKLSLPGAGQVKVAWSRDLPSPPSSVTVLKDGADRYFASLVVETDDDPLPETTPEVGIDLGLHHFAVLSDGTKVANPRFLRRAEKKLKKDQRALARTQKGSNNRVKARRSLARAHVRVADARKDFHHQLSTRLTRENQAMYGRTWTCPVCHTLHDRDVNAARIVLAAGRADRQNACGGAVRPAA